MTFLKVVKKKRRNPADERCGCDLPYGGGGVEIIITHNVLFFPSVCLTETCPKMKLAASMWMSSGA